MSRLMHSLFFFVSILSTPVQAEQIVLRKAFEQKPFIQPVALVQAGDENDRWYLVEQRGLIHTFLAKDQSRTIFVDLGDRVSSGGEKGLLGMAFHPDYPKKPFVFLSYTGKDKGELVSYVSRFTSDHKNLKINPSSEKKIISVTQPWGNHNGGHIAFGPDGYLYIGWGDGGWAGDPKNHGQNKKTLLGSLLRIDINKEPYAIPLDNPFASGKQGARKEIYAYGLRNPWRWNFDRETGELWLADVGQDDWEEINIIKKGGNYGWNIKEGTHCFAMTPCIDKSLIDPIHEYGHQFGQSITGGYVYRGKKLMAYQGQYIFGDFVSGTIWTLDRESRKSRNLAKTGSNIASFAQGNDGELYVLDYASGTISKIVAFQAGD